MSTTYAPDKYRGKVIKQGFEKASTGTPYFYVLMIILGRYDAQGVLQDCPHFERAYRQYLKGEVGVKILLADLKALGVEVTGLEQLDPGSPGAIDLCGREIDVVCEVQDYKGKPSEYWKIARQRPTVDAAALRALGDQFGHLFRNNGQPKPPPGPAANA